MTQIPFIHRMSIQSTLLLFHTLKTGIQLQTWNEEHSDINLILHRITSIRQLIIT